MNTLTTVVYIVALLINYRGFPIRTTSTSTASDGAYDGYTHRSDAKCIGFRYMYVKRLHSFFHVRLNLI